MVVDKRLLEKVVEYFGQLGFSSGQTDIYLHLLRSGQQSVLQISRGLGTGRTKLYPLLDELVARQLVTTHGRYYGTTYEARPPHVLDFIVSSREQQAVHLRHGLAGVQDTLSRVASSSPTASRIVEYQGVDGLKQMVFNLAAATDDCRTFETGLFDSSLDTHFQKRIQRQFESSPQRTVQRLIGNKKLFRSISDGSNGTTTSIRYLPQSAFRPEFDTYLYGTCVALLDGSSEEFSGVEIHSPALARQHHAIFEALWQSATSLQSN